MKKILTVIIPAILFISCTAEPNEVHPEREFVVFSITLDSETRGIHNYDIADYLNISDEFKRFTVIWEGSSSSYVFREGLLHPENESDKIWFPQNNDLLSEIEILWPCEEVRERLAAENDGKTSRNQNVRENFMASDWLNATISNLKPSYVTPVILQHSLCKVTFKLSDNYSDRRIENLTVGEFKAYCDPDTMNGQLIFNPDKDKGSLVYGTQCALKISGEASTWDYRFVDSPEDYLLKPGDNYTIVFEIE